MEVRIRIFRPLVSHRPNIPILEEQLTALLPARELAADIRDAGLHAGPIGPARGAEPVGGEASLLSRTVSATVPVVGAPCYRHVGEIAQQPEGHTRHGGTSALHDTIPFSTQCAAWAPTTKRAERATAKRGSSCMATDVYLEAMGI